MNLNIALYEWEENLTTHESYTWDLVHYLLMVMQPLRERHSPTKLESKLVTWLLHLLKLTFPYFKSLIEFRFEIVWNVTTNWRILASFSFKRIQKWQILVGNNTLYRNFCSNWYRELKNNAEISVEDALQAISKNHPSFVDSALRELWIHCPYKLWTVLLQIFICFDRP